MKRIISINAGRRCNVNNKKNKGEENKAEKIRFLCGAYNSSRRRQTSPRCRHPGEFDQTTLPGIRLVPPPVDLDETYVLSLIPAYSLSYVKKMSSTKPEVHNILYYRQRRTEPRSQVTCL